MKKLPKKFNPRDILIVLKQQVIESLEAQRPYYDNAEVEDSLIQQNEGLSTMGALSKTLVLRLIDDILLFTSIESATIENYKFDNPFHKKY